MESSKKKCGIRLAGFLAVLFFLMLPQLQCAVSAAENNPTVDYVLVLDCSGSMESSDREGLSVSAAKSFIDTIPAEQARVGVIAFGPDWGAETYVYSKDASKPTRTKVAFPLTNVSAEEAKKGAKSAISNVESQRVANKGYTTVGYALQAAADMLLQGKAEKNKACVILMSDGRLIDVEGDTDMYISTYNNQNIHEAESVKKAINDLKANGWPVYGLELAFDIQENSDTAINKSTGYYQMTRIPQETGGTKFTATSNVEVGQAFDHIFETNNNTKGQTSTEIIQNGSAMKEIQVEHLTAEMNITIRGKIDQVSSIELIDPDGNVKQYNKSVKEDSCIVSYDDNKKYVSVKLLVPKSGKWKITVHGNDGVEIAFSAIPMREMNLVLASSLNAAPKNTEVNFTVKFEYKGETVSAEKIYKDYPAELEIVETGEILPMTAGKEGYVCKKSFEKEGTYTLRASVESDVFREKKKRSNTLAMEINNSEVVVVGTIEDIELAVNEEATIDLKRCFGNQDNDVLQYKIEMDKASDLQAETEDGALLIKAGQKAGDVKVRVKVNDGTMKADVEQEFTVHVKNRPVTAASSEKINETIICNADKVPGFLRKLIGMKEDFEVDCNKLFKDPDKTPASYSIGDMDEKDVIEIKEGKDDIWTITGKSKDTVKFTILAKDGNDENVTAQQEITVKCVGATAYIWYKVRSRLIILLLILVVIFALFAIAFMGRKIHGVWDVTVGGSSEDQVKLGSLASGKKSQCKLSALLYDLELPSIDNDQIKLKGGNNLTKPVHIIGLESAEEIEYRGIAYDQVEKKLKKATLKEGQSLELRVGDSWITLNRY